MIYINKLKKKIDMTIITNFDDVFKVFFIDS